MDGYPTFHSPEFQINITSAIMGYYKVFLYFFALVLVFVKAAPSGVVRVQDVSAGYVQAQGFESLYVALPKHATSCSSTRPGYRPICLFCRPGMCQTTRGSYMNLHFEGDSSSCIGKYRVMTSARRLSCAPWLKSGMVV